MGFGEAGAYFSQVVGKRLSAVDVDGRISHQHELGGFSALRPFLGEDDRRISEGKGIPATYTYLSDEGAVSVESATSWYDPRRRDPSRGPEWRLYYPDVPPVSMCRAGDLAAVAVRRDGGLSFVFAEAGSDAESQVAWLLGIGGGRVMSPSEDLGRPVSALSVDLLRDMGVEPEAPAEDRWIGEMFRRWPDRFPSGREFSAFAREASGADMREVGPDEAVTAWYDEQTALFMGYERRDREARLGPLVTDVGEPDYDSILAVSMSIFQRRRSAAGHALEYHLEHVFSQMGIRFKAQAVTEGRKRPDFLFPSEEAYRDPSFPAASLTMLGAKTTSKDRWRQILGEADRVGRKHLVTLEQAITEAQTDEMAADDVQLVVPTPLQASYTDAQRARLWSLGDFCGHVLRLQEAV